MNSTIHQVSGPDKDNTKQRSKLPKEAAIFAKKMGIDISGLEPEAEDIWKMVNCFFVFVDV